LYKIALSIDWASLSDKLAKFYCPDNGRPTKSSRAKVGLLILKHLYQVSDVEIVKMLSRDIYAQYLCSVSIEESRTFIEPSSLVKFRKKIGLEGIKIIEQEVLNSLKRAKLLKGRKLVCDTTVVPSNICYPTDVSLLETVRQKTLQYLEIAKQFGAKTYRTYKRTAKKVFVQYQKIRHHTIQSRKRVQKKLRQFSQRNIRQLQSALSYVKETIESAGNSGVALLDKAKEKFITETQKFLDTATTILAQQKDIYKNLPVKERIISVHKPYLRPMVRGKYPIEVEFGPKILLNLKNDFLFLEHLCFSNTADSHLLESALKGYQERFDNLPTQLTADRAFWSPENQMLAEDYGITKIAIENKGKSSHLEGKPFRERLRRLRCSIEAKISLAKRKFGLDRLHYTIDSGEEIWIRLGLISMNLKTAVGYG
jgi:IS5 family transposase